MTTGVADFEVVDDVDVVEVFELVVEGVDFADVLDADVDVDGCADFDERVVDVVVEETVVEVPAVELSVVGTVIESDPVSELLDDVGAPTMWAPPLVPLAAVTAAVPTDSLRLVL